MRVAVGSENPVKIAAVEEVFSKVFGSVEVVSILIDSGVPPQPFGLDTLRGAENRAKRALEATGADYGVGIEGGLIELGGQWYNLGFVAIVDKGGFLGTGTSGWFELPPSFVERLRGGEELAGVVDSFFGVKGVGRTEGAVGVLTGNRVTRRDLYVHGLYMAMIPLLNKKIWK
jgi:inosine/xanthosine triphosphatase